eukprot:351347-Chlamydomonas_euryale.AAC.2
MKDCHHQGCSWPVAGRQSTCQLQGRLECLPTVGICITPQAFTFPSSHAVGICYVRTTNVLQVLLWVASVSERGTATSQRRQRVGTAWLRQRAASVRAPFVEAVRPHALPAARNLLDAGVVRRGEVVVVLWRVGARVLARAQLVMLHHAAVALTGRIRPAQLRLVVQLGTRGAHITAGIVRAGPAEAFVALAAHRRRDVVARAPVPRRM